MPAKFCSLSSALGDLNQGSNFKIPLHTCFRHVYSSLVKTDLVNFKVMLVITWIILNMVFMSLLLIVCEHQVTDQYGNSVDVDGCWGSLSEFVWAKIFSDRS